MPLETLLTRLYDPLFEPPLRPLRQAVLTLAAATTPAPRRVLDVCSGTGTQLRALRSAGYEAWGADLSPAMLRQARRRLAPGVAPLQNAKALAFRAGAFDLAIASMALHEKRAPTAVAMLGEMIRVVRPGGHLLLADYTPSAEASRVGRMIRFAVERAVGGNHYRNYRAYLRGGGLDGLLEGLEPRRPEPRTPEPVTRRLLAEGAIEARLLRRP
jgi:demethylmenaquinone methyltransferase/2-methoxy-6-polyprenyl-1,4-benzoquinol methylase